MDFTLPPPAIIRPAPDGWERDRSGLLKPIEAGVLPGMGAMMSSQSAPYVLATGTLATKGTGGALTQSFTCPTGTTCLVAIILVGNDNGTDAADVSAVSYNGNALSVACTVNDPSSDNSGKRSKIMYLMSPPTGSAYTYTQTGTGGLDKYQGFVLVALGNVSTLVDTDIKSGGASGTSLSTTAGIDTTGSTFIAGCSLLEPGGGTYTVSLAADTWASQIAVVSPSSWPGIWFGGVARAPLTTQTYTVNVTAGAPGNRCSMAIAAFGP